MERMKLIIVTSNSNVIKERAMPQIILFILDGLTSLINLVGSVKGFKNSELPPMIIEKTVYIPAKEVDHEKKTVNPRKSDSSYYDGTYFFAQIVLAVVLLMFSVWFNTKFHNALVMVTSGLALVMTIVYVLQGKKYSLPVKEQVKNWYLFSQPLLFSVALSLYKKSFEFESASRLFLNCNDLQSVIATMTGNIFSGNNLAIPFGFYHLFESFFIFFLLLA